MAKAKKKTDDCADRLKALADETRLAVLRSLLQGPKHVNQINADLKIEQALLSHHLRILREAHLVKAQRDGKAVLYSLSDDVAVPPAKGDCLDLGCCKLSFE